MKTREELLHVPNSGCIDLPNGCALYWKMDPRVGCREYYSDENGVLASVWNTALVDQGTLLAAIVQEMSFQKKEFEKQRDRERSSLPKV
jgi:hypothetical protein